MEYSRLTDIKALATLKAIVERGGVSEAAKLLHIGQPAVSKRIHSLELSCDATLMLRESGRLQLTEAGKLVYQFAVQTLEQHRALSQALNNLKQGKKTLRLEVTMAIGEHFMPQWLIHFMDAHPFYRVESRLAYGREIEAHLATGNTDLAVMESAPDHPDILVQQWRQDELVLVCGKNHPWANRLEISLKDLENLSYVLREKDSAVREQLEHALEDVKISNLNIAMEVGSTDAIMDILHRGNHVSFLPWFAVAKDIGAGNLVKLKVFKLKIIRTLWIARNRSALQHPVANAFIDMLHNN